MDRVSNLMYGPGRCIETKQKTKNLRTYIWILTRLFGKKSYIAFSKKKKYEKIHLFIEFLLFY